MIEQIKTELIDKLQKNSEHLENEYGQIMTGGAHPSILFKINFSFLYNMFK